MNYRKKINTFILKKINLSKLNYPRFIFRISKLFFNVNNIQEFKEKVKINYEILIKKNKDISINYFWFRLFGYLWLLTSMWEKNEYYNLKNSECVLDLWGFVWDSALEIIKNSKKVYVFEPQPENFKYIKRNIKENNLSDRIIAYNKLVNSKWWSVEKLFGWSFRWRTTAIQIERFWENDSEEVSSISIKEVLGLDSFDAIKMDIEGGEFEIVNFFLDEPDNFLFKKWIIEFHFSNGDENYNLLTFGKFIGFLKDNNYTFYMYKSIKPDIKFDYAEFEEKYPMSWCLCYFEKRNW